MKHTWLGIHDLQVCSLNFLFLSFTILSQKWIQTCDEGGIPYPPNYPPVLHLQKRKPPPPSLQDSPGSITDSVCLVRTGLHQDRLKALHKTYSNEKRKLLDATCREQANTATESEFACEFLQTVIYDMDTRNSHRHRAGTSNAAAKQDELRNQVRRS